ncbi:MAG: phage head closure protein [Betaproteobacteria bacterium]
MARRTSVGLMRQKVQIQYQTRTADGGGSQSVAWTRLADVWAQIQPQSGNERFFGDQLEDRVTHIITVRFRRDVTHKNRIQYIYYVDSAKYTRTFNIKRVINRDTSNRFLDILVEEGVAT